MRHEVGPSESVESLAASSCTREARALVRVGTAVLVVRGVTTGILYRFEFTLRAPRSMFGKESRQTVEVEGRIIRQTVEVPVLKSCGRVGALTADVVRHGHGEQAQAIRFFTAVRHDCA